MEIVATMSLFLRLKVTTEERIMYWHGTRLRKILNPHQAGYNTLSEAITIGHILSNWWTLITMVIWMLSARKPGHLHALPFFLTTTVIFQRTLLLLKAREYIREQLKILITMVMSILLEKTPIPTNHIRGITKTYCCLTKIRAALVSNDGSYYVLKLAPAIWPLTGVMLLCAFRNVLKIIHIWQ